MTKPAVFDPDPMIISLTFVSLDGKVGVRMETSQRIRNQIGRLCVTRGVIHRISRRSRHEKLPLCLPQSPSARWAPLCTRSMESQ